MAHTPKMSFSLRKQLATRGGKGHGKVCVQGEPSIKNQVTQTMVPSSLLVEQRERTF